MTATHEVLNTVLGGRPPAHLVGEALELSPDTRGLMGAHSERVHLLPAADATLVGVGVGIALSGAAVVVELSGPSALWGALQQLGQEAGTLSQGEFGLRLVIRVPVAPDEDVPAAVLAGLAGVSTAWACDDQDAAVLLEQALSSRNPVVLLVPRQRVDLPDLDGPVALGAARRVQSGDHATVLAVGPGVGPAVAAARALQAEGVEVDVLDLRGLSPLDSTAIGESVQRTGRPVAVGLAAAALQVATEQAFLRLESPPMVAAPDAASIVRAVRQAIQF